jgi:bifunctional enzyme CysN/CysC
MPWYAGPTLLEALDALPQPAAPGDAPLRLWLQDVYKFDERRILAGRIESGRLAVGDRIVFSPSNASARVASIESWNAPQPRACAAGQSVGFTLDEDIFVERGHVVSHAARAPLVSNVFRARLFWLGRRPLAAGQQLRLRHGTAETPVVIERIERVLNTDDLSAAAGDVLPGNGVGEVMLRTRGLLAIDDHAENPITGRFVLVDGELIVGGGIIAASGIADQRRPVPKSDNLFAVAHRISALERAGRNGHRGAILWFTGLSGAGKSTIAKVLQVKLLEQGGRPVTLLDGDLVRKHLSSELGFSKEHRDLNVRRIGFVASEITKNGGMAICAPIAPYDAIRKEVRQMIEPLGGFVLVHVATTLEECERRDRKGLYAKARAGILKGFTGIDDPYEVPEKPELRLDTTESTPDMSAHVIIVKLESLGFIK